MFSIAEQKRSEVDQVDKTNVGLRVLLDVDQTYTRYELDLVPDYAVKAAQMLGRDEMAAFIDQVNRLLLPYRRDGSALYGLRLGRRHVQRLIVVDLFKGTFPHPERYKREIGQIAIANGAANVANEEGQTSLEISVFWD